RTIDSGRRCILEYLNAFDVIRVNRCKGIYSPGLLSPGTTLPIKSRDTLGVSTDLNSINHIKRFTASCERCCTSDTHRNCPARLTCILSDLNTGYAPLKRLIKACRDGLSYIFSTYRRYGTRQVTSALHTIPHNHHLLKRGDVF